MNKIYSVLRLDNWNNDQEVYTGELGTAKKSENYRGRIQKRGWEIKNYEFSLIVKTILKERCIYISNTLS